MTDRTNIWLGVMGGDVAVSTAESTRARHCWSLMAGYGWRPRLHDLIVGLSGNSIMVDCHRRVMSQTEFIRLYTAPPERATETEIEHRRFYGFASERSQAAQHAVHEHFESACRSPLPAIAEVEFNAASAWEM